MNRDELVAAYQRRPLLAAKRVAEHQLRALQAMDAGELDQAVAHWDRVDLFHDVLDVLVRCRRCGRKLSDPRSVERRIGPECWEKTGIGGCPFCGGTGRLAAPDPVLGGYTDHNCFCQDRPRTDHAISGEITDPAGASI